MKYIVKYTGVFGFMKPWTAVRDSKIRSSFYLSPSTLMGMERKLFPELLNNENGKLNKISRYRLSFDGVSFINETTQAINYTCKSKMIGTESSIISRGTLINPVLYLMFDSVDDAEDAMSQHICLSRNEDVLYPTNFITLSDENEFDDENKFPGYESFACGEDSPRKIFCGFNKYSKEKQFMSINVVGEPSNF